MSTILFAGGGTLGPVTPLIAVSRRLRMMRPDLTFAWAGTGDGPERNLVMAEGIPLYAVPTAKLSRFPSIGWLTFPFSYMSARRAANEMLDTTKPSLVIGAGGYSQVPVMQAASKRGIRCAIHQLDREPGLSNRVVAPLCASVTTSFDYDKPPFGAAVRAQRIATPCRFAGAVLPSKDDARTAFGLDGPKPVVLVMGGGTGAQAINRALDGMCEELRTEANIIHVTGSGKLEGRTSCAGYVVREALDEQGMLDAYAAADVVVSRAGMGSIAELAALSKATILIPMPRTHQEKNAEALGDAVIRLRQDALLHVTLIGEIRRLTRQELVRQKLGEMLHRAMPTDDGMELANVLIQYL